MMRGKTCVITGANSGLGYWTTLALAKKGLHIFMLCRSIDRGEKARIDITTKTGNKDIELILVDLSSLASINKAVEKIKKLTNQVDVLINNAATVSSQRKLTEDGIESQFAINHIAPFCLTHRLLPLLMKSPDGRVINISSTNHRRGKLHFEDVNLTTNYNILRAYNQSKLANVMFSYELNRNLIARNIKNLGVYCVDPGHNNTPIGLKNTKNLHYLVWLLRSKMGKSPARGAECQIFVAINDHVKSVSGRYWKNSKTISSSRKSYNETDAQRLWEISLELCGVQDFFKIT
ncbi:SDR family oxidoreductase [Bacteroidota bacterium]